MTPWFAGEWDVIDMPFLDLLNLECAGVAEPTPTIDPPQTPVTIRDIEVTGDFYHETLHLADPCPACGAFNMQVGDYMYIGFCSKCWGDTYME
jgi:hypothetical protein